MIPMMAALIVALGTTSLGASPQAKVSKSALAAALLAVSDMPTGWSSYPIPASAKQPGNTGACNKPNSFARAKALKSVADAEAAFVQDPQSGPLIGEAAFAFPSIVAAKKMMAKPDLSCGQFDVDNGDGTTTHYDGLGEMSFPTVGDQSIAWRDRETKKKGSASATSFSQDSVAFRVGKVVAVLTRTGLSSDTGEVQSYVNKAVAKLSDSLGSGGTTKAATSTTVKALSYPNGSPVVDGYPKLVPIASIDSRVKNWMTLNPPPSDQAVEVAPGVFAAYNPAVPDLSTYLNGSLEGDCAVFHQYFPHSGGTCWDGVAAT